MTVRVKLFALARETAGRGEIVVHVDDSATVADVRRALLAIAPQLQPVLSHARWAVDAEFVNDLAPVNGSSEIAVIPPVSGG